jgi:hypothetical protein
LPAKFREETKTLNLESLDGSSRSVVLPVDRLIVAGWAARDQAAAEAHIRELEALGIPRPGKTPEFYHLSRTLLTTAFEIEVMGRDSTGEVECVLFSNGDDLYIGVGSDHTDRKAEVWGITLAKQLCSKPVSSQVWNYRDLTQHWDELVLRSYAITGQEQTLYQEGKVSLLLPPFHLQALYSQQPGYTSVPNMAMFCGTVPTCSSIYWADAFHVELFDPVLNRRLTHQYNVHPLAVT